MIKILELRVSDILRVKVKVVIKCGFNFVNYRQNLLKRSFCHIAFMWERNISHQYPNVKRKVTESARYVPHTQ